MGTLLYGRAEPDKAEVSFTIRSNREEAVTHTAGPDKP